jgi:glycosyltransferase involved in cell wall biosynthesis
VERTEDRAPRVSVIVPLYQSRDYVATALDSVLAQTFGDLEVIVVDDGSTDGGDQIVRDYAEDDPRVNYIRQENTGPSAARNAGIAAAQARVVAFLDSDDLWLPDKLDVQMAFVAENTVVYSEAYVIRDGGEIGAERVGGPVEPRVGSGVFEALLEANPIAVLTTVMPRDLLLANGCFDVDLRGVEDYDLWLRLAAAGTRFKYIPAPLGAYRIHSGSISADRVRMSTSKLRLYEKLAASSAPGRRRAVRARIRRERRVLATELWRYGRRAIALGETAEGRTYLTRAVRAAPGWWRCWLVAGLLAVPVALKPIAVRSERRAARAAGSS